MLDAARKMVPKKPFIGDEANIALLPDNKTILGPCDENKPDLVGGSQPNLMLLRKPMDHIGTYPNAEMVIAPERTRRHNCVVSLNAQYVADFAKAWGVDAVTLCMNHNAQGDVMEPLYVMPLGTHTEPGCEGVLMPMRPPNDNHDRGPSSRNRKENLAAAEHWFEELLYATVKCKHPHPAPDATIAAFRKVEAAYKELKDLLDAEIKAEETPAPVTPVVPPAVPQTTEPAAQSAPPATTAS